MRFQHCSPPTAFRRDMKNRMARYLMAVRCDDLYHEREQQLIQEYAEPADTPLSISKLLNNARNLLTKRPLAWVPGQPYLTGFVGLWYMVDEAHIVSVGVRTEYRGYGIGELLVIGAIEQAMTRKANVVTLEVRVSNSIAQNLYAKYGFKKRGIRKGYYTDNREDAVIMTTDSIQEATYYQHFQGLAESNESRWGYVDRVLS